MRSTPLLILMAVLAAPVARGEPPAPAAATDVTARLKALRSRAEAWWAQRRKLGVVCYQCRGTGQVLYRRAMHTCPKCDGRKRLAPAEVYREIWYEARSPAFRAREGTRERLEAEYKAALRSGVPEVFQVRIERHEMVDDVHGVVYVAENKDATARPQRWIWAEEVGRQAGWWLWDEGADGGWPGTAPAPGTDQGAEGEPLAPQESEAVSGLLKGATSLQHKVAGGSKNGTVLLLTMDVGPQPGGTDLQMVALEDWRLVGRAVWSGPSVWTEVRWRMRARHRDKFGAVEFKTYLRGRITRADFERIRWDNLEPAERLALFAPRTETHEGWLLWRQE